MGVSMKRLLWIGDAVAATGFSKVTHKVLEHLKDWEIFVLGLNYYGEPHDYPYKIFPCVDPYRNARNMFGFDRMGEMIQYYAPDLIVVQNDPWNIPTYLKYKGDVRMVAVVPVDGHNVGGNGLNGLVHAIFWTEFGRGEAETGGYTGKSSVIPLGVDRSLYHPFEISKKELRIQQALPERLHDAFIVGNVNRNQPRKRLDLTISFFCQWVKDYNIPDAYLYLHAAPTGEMEYNLSQLMEYYGLAARCVTFIPNVGHGIPEQRMPVVYNTFDAQISTTQGEGWGLTTLEGMACGVPQVVPNWSAYKEWVPEIMTVPCTEIACTMNGINIIGGIPGREFFIQKMHELYSNQEFYDTCVNTSLETAVKYDWGDIGQMYNDVLEEIWQS